MILTGKGNIVLLVSRRPSKAASISILPSLKTPLSPKQAGGSILRRLTRASSLLPSTCAVLFTLCLQRSGAQSSARQDAMRPPFAERGPPIRLPIAPFPALVRQRLYLWLLLSYANKDWLFAGGPEPTLRRRMPQKAPLSSISLSLSLL